MDGVVPSRPRSHRIDAAKQITGDNQEILIYGR